MHIENSQKMGGGINKEEPKIKNQVSLHWGCENKDTNTSYVTTHLGSGMKWGRNELKGWVETSQWGYTVFLLKGTQLWWLNMNYEYENEFK